MHGLERRGNPERPLNARGSVEKARSTASVSELKLTRKDNLRLSSGRRMGAVALSSRRDAMEDVVLRPGGTIGGLGPFAMAPPGMKRRPDGGFEKAKLVRLCETPAMRNQLLRGR